MSRLRRVLDFWWDFVVGDDWRVAAAVVAGLVLTAALSRITSASWWILPIVVSAALIVSVRRVARRADDPGES
jgi:hypothetical protein